MSVAEEDDCTLLFTARQAHSTLLLPLLATYCVVIRQSGESNFKLLLVPFQLLQREFFAMKPV